MLSILARPIDGDTQRPRARQSRNDEGGVRTSRGLDIDTRVMHEAGEPLEAASKLSKTRAMLACLPLLQLMSARTKSVMALR